VLPIDLILFQARLWSGSVVLTWKTAMERNNKVFHIERSTDQLNWTELGSVAGNGSTSQISDYTWTDAHPLNGTSYYRLRQEDYDGKSSLSPIQQVSLESSSAGFRIYPNPAHDRIQVDHPGTTTRLELIDLYGRRVREIQTTGVSTSVSISDLTAGTYFLRSGTDVRKFIKD
jgi:hypothetical protein